MPSPAFPARVPSARIFSWLKRVGLALFAMVFPVTVHAAELTPPIRVGIIGLDAHAVPWTRIINDPQVAAPISEMRVVAALATPSADIPFSQDKNDTNTAMMRDLGVEIASSIEELVSKVDAVMLLSVDGRPHPRQAEAVFKSKKPLFIDKPVAASLAETIKVFRRAEESGTPCFSNSALRYGPATVAIAHDPKIGRVLGCDAFCNNKSILPGHPDLFYYGIHGCEILFTIMGPGCETVSRLKTATADQAAGVWKDGRLGTFRGILQGQVGYGATVFGEKGIGTAGKFEGYEPLLAEIVQFFKTGRPPVTVEQTLEIYAFMEAADESLRRGGAAVSLSEVLAKGRQQADAHRKP